MTGAIVDGGFGKWRNAREVGGLQQTLIAQAFEAEEQRIAGEGGETLVGRIAISGGIQRQHLPQFLSGIGQEVGELVGGRAEVADAEACGQGSEVEQNSTAAGEFHFVRIRRWAGHPQEDEGM